MNTRLAMNSTTPAMAAELRNERRASVERVDHRLRNLAAADSDHLADHAKIGAGYPENPDFASCTCLTEHPEHVISLPDPGDRRVQKIDLNPLPP